MQAPHCIAALRVATALPPKSPLRAHAEARSTRNKDGRFSRSRRRPMAWMQDLRRHRHQSRRRADARRNPQYRQAQFKARRASGIGQAVAMRIAMRSRRQATTRSWPSRSRRPSWTWQCRVMARQMMRRIDTRRMNGQISKQEAETAFNKFFDRMDRNKDGVISIDDMPDQPSSEGNDKAFARYREGFAPQPKPSSRLRERVFRLASRLPS